MWKNFKEHFFDRKPKLPSPASNSINGKQKAGETNFNSRDDQLNPL